MGSMGRRRRRRTRSTDGGPRIGVESQLPMHWPFGSNRYGWRGAYDSFEAGTLVRWRVVGKLILIWSAVILVLILALTALGTIV